MPFKARRPAGGFRVMYEYANRLCALGYSVHITYSLKTKYMKYRLPYFIRVILSYLEGFRTNKWFDFDSRVTMSYAKGLIDKHTIDSDIIIATWWATVMEVGQLSESKGKKINLIQGYENWEGHTDLLHATYRISNITNIVVASYLKTIVEEYSNKPVHFIPNAINTNYFKVIRNIEERIPTKIGMLYSLQEIKGTKYGVEALMMVKNEIPNLEVELFGVCPEPANLPDWMTFYRNPNNLSQIYNNNAIFISNSLTEGFGLVSVEAMACGCSLICTDISGHQEYAFEGNTAVLVPVKDSRSMAQAIIRLIEDREYRIELAKNGNNFVQKYSWSTAVEKMDHLIKGLLNEDTSNR